MPPSPGERQPEHFLTESFQAMLLASMRGDVPPDKGGRFYTLNSVAESWVMKRIGTKDRGWQFKWFIFNKRSRDLRVHEVSITATDRDDHAVLTDNSYVDDLIEIASTLERASPSDWKELRIGLALGREAEEKDIERTIREAEASRPLSEFVQRLMDDIVNERDEGDPEVNYD